MAKIVSNLKGSVLQVKKDCSGLHISGIVESIQENSSSEIILKLQFACRFWQHMCMAAKVDGVVTLVKDALKSGKCVVVGLQNTGILVLCFLLSSCK